MIDHEKSVANLGKFVVDLKKKSFDLGKFVVNLTKKPTDREDDSVNDENGRIFSEN
ncbi:MAG: hypothetical protein ABL959_00430 [Pyrinomonadaceae bacterium]